MGHVMKYDEQLADPKWIRKRMKILRRDSYKCVNCNSSHNLNVHHKYYVRGHKAWEYPNKALVTLCNVCHKTWHDTHDLEVRDAVWNKNRDYIIPKKRPRKGSVKPKKIKKRIKFKQGDRYHGLSESQKRKLKMRDKKKLELIMSYHILEDCQGVFEKTRTLTIEELEEYLSKDDSSRLVNS